MHEHSSYDSARQESAAARGFFRIGEVSRLTDTKPFVLRYWETEFPMLQPVKSPKGHRLYRHEDVETVRHIKHLLYDEGFTIAGARRHLSEAGAAPPTNYASSNYVAPTYSAQNPREQDLAEHRRTEQGPAEQGHAASGHVAPGYAAQAEDNFSDHVAPAGTPDRDFRAPQADGAPSLFPADGELPGTQELSGARLSAQFSSDLDGAAAAHRDRAAADLPAPELHAAERPATARPMPDRPMPDRPISDHLMPDRPISPRAAADHAALGRAIVDRKVLLDLRDALRSLLTLLETE